MWGDPHITTLDDKKYSYQGLGTFWLLKGKTVEIQGQTKRIKTPSGALTNATVWCGIAINDLVYNNNTGEDQQAISSVINIELTQDSQGS